MSQKLSPSLSDQRLKRKHDELSIERQGRMMFLVKLPKAVMKAWCNPNLREGTELGTAVLTEGKGGKKTVVTLPEGLCQNAPREYNLEFAADCTGMRVFSVKGNDTLTANVSIEGYVRESGYMRPKHNLGYRRQLRKRQRDQYINAKRTAEFFDPEGLGGVGDQGRNAKEVTMRRTAANISTKLHPDALSRKEMKQRNKEMKAANAKAARVKKLEEKGLGNLITLGRGKKTERRERMDDERLREELFSLFGEQPHWRMKDIHSTHINVGTSQLKQALRELCIYARKGPNKGTYELKEEFRTETRVTEANK